MNTINLNIQSIYNAHFAMHYRGVSAVKCPFDYVIYQMIVSELKPDLIIEIGTCEGGSALYLADLLELNKKGILHTIDIEKRVTSNLVLEHPRIKYYPTGGYEEYDIKNTIGYTTILIIDDGSHEYDDVLKALRKFNSIVSPNSYYIVEDGAIIDTLNIRNTFGGGPTIAVEEFLKENTEFQIDDKWCNFFGKTSTFNGNGYLKKKDKSKLTWGYTGMH